MRAAGLALLLLCAACTPTFVPKHDALWDQAVAWGPHDPTGCLHNSPASLPDCASPNQRVEKYLFQLMPVSPLNMVDHLKLEGFECADHPAIDMVFNESLQFGDYTTTEHAGKWVCTYSKIHTPQTCAVALRVSIEVTFPTSVSEVKGFSSNTVITKDSKFEDKQCTTL